MYFDRWTQRFLGVSRDGERIQAINEELDGLLGKVNAGYGTEADYLRINQLTGIIGMFEPDKAALLVEIIGVPPDRLT